VKPSNGGHLASATAVTLDDVLSHLTTRSMVPSPLGAMLAMMRDGVSGGRGSPSEISDRQHQRMLSQAAIIRCVEGVLAVDRFDADFQKDLHNAASATGRGEGYIVVSVMRAFQQWSLISTERAYAAVWCWLQRESGSQGHGDPTADRLAELFRLDQAKNARGRAKGLEQDCRTILGAWVSSWNKKQK
jgi:hypothetical protein